ncbi:MAG TPA: HAMP domain-containing sensor histidine kinase [Prosthecobacter sp.]|nr:HAMP domain-containing sensor histidine kinase [Prosthecobacter sp.]
MRSIQAQVIAWLLPGFVCVCALAGWGVYHSEKQAIEADLDARLGRLVGAARLVMRNHMMPGNTRMRGSALRAFLAKEEFQVLGQYFELWETQEVTGRRSPNLGNWHLPRPPELTRDTIRYDATLESGERVRISAMLMPQGSGMPPLEFAVALSRSEGDARLSKLMADLVMGGVACCVVLCLLLALALRIAMRPLARVGEQAAAMGAGTLHERFALEAMPVEIAPIVARLNDLMARLEEGFERERRFSGYLAHELRTPLAVIRSTAEVAAKWPEQSSPEDFQEIAQAAARLQQTVDGLLLLSRAESSSADVTSEPVVLGPLIEECLALHVERVKKRDLTFELRLDPRATVETDPRLLRIIVSNLIANATEYAPAGSGIVVTAGAEDEILRVGNLAPGLTEEDLPRLFDRLWRKDAVRGDAEHAGLGLAIASSCAVALGLGLTAELDGSMIQMLLRREK